MNSLRHLALGLLLAGCKAGPPPLAIADGCQPLLAGADCLLPYPSDFFLVPDATQPSGSKLQLSAAARMHAKQGGAVDVNLHSPADGFSRVSPVVFVFPQDPAAAGTVRLEDDPASSTDPAKSNTLLVDETSGQPVPHFVDLDPRATDGTRRAIVLHPYVAMNEKTRYAVFVQRFTQTGGAAIPAPEGFRRVRDDDTGGQAALEPFRVAWKHRLEPLARKLGVDSKQVQLAWEFTTGSQEQVTRDMLKVRQLTMAWVASNTPTVTVTSVALDDSPLSWKVINGTVTGPLYMETADPGAKLHRDSSGAVAQNGTAQFAFRAVVPVTVRDQFAVGQTFLYGHGFFGSLAELTGNSARGIANDTHRTMIGCEWWGMSLPDVGPLADALTSNPSNALLFADRVHQGMANWIILSSAIETVLPGLDDFRRPTSGEGTSTSGGTSNAGQPFLEASAASYLGISQGHILGGTMCTLNPFIHRCALQMGGVALTSLMMRAGPFRSLFSLLEISIEDPLDQQKLLATFQRPLDRFDGATWAQYTLTTELPGSPDPPRRVLMQMGLGDVEVPNLGTFMHARLLGLPVMQPSPVLPFGLQAASGPVDGSALEIADYGLNTADLYRVATFPEVSTPVHDDLRTRATTKQQIEHFWETGQVKHFCSDVCNPD